jgi:hypothetical protein
MRIGVGIGQKGLKPHRSEAARGDNDGLALLELRKHKSQKGLARLPRGRLPHRHANRNSRASVCGWGTRCFGGKSYHPRVSAICPRKSSLPSLKVVVCKTCFVVGSRDSSCPLPLRSTRHVESPACIFAAGKTVRGIRPSCLSSPLRNCLASQSLDLRAEVRLVE